MNPSNDDILIDDFEWIDETNIDGLTRKKSTDGLAMLSLTEMLGHNLAYSAPQRRGGEVHYIENISYTVVKIQTESAGLVGELFIPKNPESSQKVFINWTGTHNAATALANLERAPGEDSFRHDELSILKQINQAVADVHQKSGKKVELVVAGHSLGGAVAQLNFHALQRAIGTNGYESNLEKENKSGCFAWIDAEMAYRRAIDSNELHTLQDLPSHVRTHLKGEHIASMTLGVWNSAGVLKTIEANSNQIAPLVAQNGVKQNAYFGMVSGDPVQQTGAGTVLSQVDSKDANVVLAKFDKGDKIKKKKLVLKCAGTAAVGTVLLGTPIGVVGGLAFGLYHVANGTKNAHTARHFASQSMNTEDAHCQLHTNATLEGKCVIKDQLTKKSSVLQAAPVKAVQNAFNYIKNKVYSTAPVPTAAPVVKPAPVQQSSWRKWSPI